MPLAPGLHQGPYAVQGSVVCDTCGSMNPARKRTVRLVVALSAAVVLARSARVHELQRREPALTPTQLVREAQPGQATS